MTHHQEQADPLLPVLDAAHRAGNPVPGGDPQRWPDTVQAIRRRWSSFTRRHPVPAADTRGARVEDLARGLLARCAAGGRTVIEISDCRALARRLADVLGSVPDAGARAAGPAGVSR